MTREQGREYFQQRGICLATIEYAEDTGMVRYAEGAVFFVGYDRVGRARSATWRAIDLADPVQKREIMGSDKGYPPVLPGNPTSVWIVEGGVDALALHDLARRAGKSPPPTIVSGGATVLSFLHHTEILEILKHVERIIVAGENEKHPAAQERADTGHRKQAQLISEISEREVIIWAPKVGKDLAKFIFLRFGHRSMVSWERLSIGGRTRPTG